jgi:hypothetical protein
MADSRIKSLNCLEGLRIRSYCSYKKERKRELIRLIWFFNKSFIFIWIFIFCNGTKNITEDQRAYLIGKSYKEEKKTEGRPKILDHCDPVTVEKSASFDTFLNIETPTPSNSRRFNKRSCEKRTHGS